MSEGNGKPANGTAGKGDELARLAKEIKDALGRAEQSEWDRLDSYRSAGERLAQAKKLCPHGSWEKWLKENFGWKSDRQAQKYMRFAKAPRKALLPEEKKAWAQASGAAKAKGKTGKAAKPKLPDDGSRVIQLPKAFVGEVDVKVTDLVTPLLGETVLMDGLVDVAGTDWVFVAALRFAHRAFCGGKSLAEAGQEERAEGKEVALVN